MSERLSRRDLLRIATVTAAGALASKVPVEAQGTQTEPSEAKEKENQLPFEKGKYQTFPRQVIEMNGVEVPVYQYIDIGTLGPDVDTIVGIDFPGDIPTSALVVYQPKGEVKETRVVFIKRTDVEAIQLKRALGGDRFDVHQISEYGGDQALDAMARLRAQNTARRHQKVVYLGDMGLFQKEWGAGEKPLLQAIIRAQRPGNVELGIPEPNFVNPRSYTPDQKTGDMNTHSFNAGLR